MQPLPFDVHVKLDGWTLFWADLELATAEGDALERLIARTVERARGRLDPKALPGDPTVAAMRRLFRAAGCDPTRYRPSSEALLRRILKGEELPAIHPFVDMSNCLSAELAVPCCVMAADTFEPPLVFRAGREDESYVSLRGPFRLNGKPLLCDARGPLDCPITGNERVKITKETRRCWLVAYMPAATADPATADGSLHELVAAAPVVRILLTGVT